MLMRSTGLGKTQLDGNVTAIKRQGDYLIMYVDVVDPVKWKLRVALSFKDVLKVLKSVFTGDIMGFVLSTRQWSNKEPQHPGDF